MQLFSGGATASQKEEEEWGRKWGRGEIPSFLPFFPPARGQPTVGNKFLNPLLLCSTHGQEREKEKERERRVEGRM